MTAQLVAFLGVAALVIATPGPDTALTIQNALVGGRRSGVATALGVGAGQAVWTVATSAGLAALLVASEPVFELVRLLGAAYLVVLGMQALGRALGGRRTDDVRSRAGSGHARAAFRQGLLSNLSNPKMAVFFTSLLPQVAPGGKASFPALLALGLLFCGMTISWLTAYAAAVAKAGAVLRRPAARRALEAVTGTVLVALGLRLATERR